MDLLKNCGKIVHRIDVEIKSNHGKFINELIEQCPNLFRVIVKFRNRCVNDHSLGHDELLKLAKIHVKESASFIFYQSNFEQAEQVFDDVHPNGNEKINFYNGHGPGFIF